MLQEVAEIWHDYVTLWISPRNVMGLPLSIYVRKLYKKNLYRLLSLACTMV